MRTPNEILHEKKKTEEEHERFVRWCVLGAIGAVLMAAGDWLLGCVPLQQTDTGLFNRACYLSGSYGLWRPVLTVGLGAIGGFLYYFAVKAQNEIDRKVVELVKREHEKAKKILLDNREKLDALANYLYEKETITGDEFMKILKDEEPAAITGTETAETETTTKEADANEQTV